MSPDLSGVDVPLWAVAATTHVAHFHQLGGSGAYLSTPTPNKKLDFWEDWFRKAYATETFASHKAFFDHWLKGIDNGIMDVPPVRLEIRTGNGASFVLQENEWPVARTNYTRWYLDATSAEWAGTDARSDFLRLSMSEPSVERQRSYSAEVRLLPPGVGAAIRLDPESPESNPQINGISFISEPLGEDIVLAGYGKAGMWVSSSAADMDIYVSVRAVNEDGREVDYTSFATMGFGDRPTPLMKGWLKVSHRTLDIDDRRSTAQSTRIARPTTRHWRTAKSYRWKSNSYPTRGSFERDSASGSTSSHTTASLTACITPMTRAITTARPTPCTQVRGMSLTCSFLSSRFLFRIPQFPRRSSKPVSNMGQEVKL